jgi:hypothetical protein
MQNFRMLCLVVRIVTGRLYNVKCSFAMAHHQEWDGSKYASKLGGSHVDSRLNRMPTEVVCAFAKITDSMQVVLLKKRIVQQ